MNNSHDKRLHDALQSIAQTDVPDRVNLWPAMQQQLDKDSVTMKQPTFNWSLGRAAAAAVVVLVIAVSLPPVRTFARNMLYQIGGIKLINEPSRAEQAADDPMPTPDPNTVIPTAAPPPIYSLEEVSTRAGFPVYEIGTVPDGYVIEIRDGLQQGNGIDWAHTIYFGPTVDGKLHIFGLDQTRYAENLPEQYGQFEIGDAPVTEVTVRGLPGLWVEAAPTAARPSQTNPNGWEIDHENMLIWEEDGFTFLLRSNALTQAEMLAIAESITK